MTTGTASSTNYHIRGLVRLALASTLIGAGVMALAGRWDSPYLWAFALGILLVGGYAVFGVLDPDLARERFRPPENGADATALIWIRLSPIAALILAPLDAGRLHWSAPMPATVQIVAIGGFFVGFWFTLHAM